MSVIAVNWKLGGELEVTELVDGFELQPLHAAGSLIPVEYVSAPIKVKVRTIMRDPEEIRGFFRKVR
jgi:hypothetical protein